MALKSNWSKKELRQLRESLPSTWAADLAELHKLSVGAVQNVIYGTAVNDAVVLSAVKLATKHKEFILSQKQVIKSL